MGYECVAESIAVLRFHSCFFEVSFERSEGYGGIAAWAHRDQQVSVIGGLEMMMMMWWMRMMKRRMREIVVMG